MSEEFLRDKLASAARIKRIREMAGYTQEQFAEILGISLSGYKKIENAENQISLKILRRLKKKMQVSADFVLFGADDDLGGLWDRIQNCTDADKMYLFIKMLFYFTGVKGSAFYLRDNQEELDKAILKVMNEIQKYRED